jgi:hypothetical protein
LTTDELAKILGVLDKIDRGLSAPHFPDRIGRFFRQYHTGRARLDEVLSKRGLERRVDAAISGHALRPIEVHPIREPQVSVLEFPLGEVAETLAISEELGGLIHVTMWLKGPIANAAYNVLKEDIGLRLSDDYRWTPPARVTPGEARVEASEMKIAWCDARCLKSVADDLARPPHALEYVLDYRLGEPGIKYFRCVCVVKSESAWQVLPGFGESMHLDVVEILPQARPKLNRAQLAALLIYREPWSPGWTVVDAVVINEEGAFAHAITWADFQKELDGTELDGKMVSGIRQSLRHSGLHLGEFAEPNLRRNLFPAARDVSRWLRGVR